MYEEHLWNLEHGKGFRSYLDQGLFLGEHIQVVHVLLVPLHVIWPHHLLLEVCESAALALGAIPVFLLARRHGASERAALLLAVAFLLYYPLQYLDTTIDLKTLRPNAFGVPAVLWAMERLERGRYWQMALWLLLAPVVGYGFAWVGHFVFEKNRPATFTHPVYSLVGDFVMWKDMLVGRIRF